MSEPSDYLMSQATKLVEQCERSGRLLRTALECADRGVYDPISDLYAMRVPGDLIRSIRALLEPTDPGGTP